jgi:regulatory protein
VSDRAPPEGRTKPVTATYLERAAVAYLERWGSSSANLRRVLVRKATRRGGTPPDADVLAAIEETVAKAIRSGLVDDRAYAQSKLRGLLSRGASARTAGAKLAAKGLDRGTVAEALREAAPDEFAQARRYAERRRLGPWRSAPDTGRREKDLAVLARAGFSYRAAVAAIDGGKEQA